MLPFATFNSTVKKVQLILYPSISGVPSMLWFSILVHRISLDTLLSFSYNFLSGFKITRDAYSEVLGAIINFCLVGFNTTRIEFCPIIFDSCTSILLIINVYPSTPQARKSF